VLYPFTTFLPFRLKATGPLLAEPVEIATIRADGPPVQVYSRRSHKPTRPIDDELEAIYMWSDGCERHFDYKGVRHRRP
jgi:hypothetical protein